MGVKLKPYIEPKLIIYLFGFYTFIALVDFIRVYLMYYTSNRTLESLLDLALIIALDWVFVICFMSLVSIGTKYLLTIKVKWSWIIVLHAILSFVQSFAVSFISPLVLGEIPSRPELTLFDQVWQIFFTNVTTNVLLYSTIILIIYMYFYLKQVKHQEQKNKILENSLIRFKLKSLENQLNPHFLFNSLNTVSSLIGSNKKQAQDMLADISELFRKYLDNNHSNVVTVQEELELLSYYVNILKKRFRDDFKYNQQVAFDTLDCTIPRLIVQPLIENSIKHGYAPGNPKLTVELTIKRTETHIVIEVYNDGSKMLLSKRNLGRQGIGISNINERLKALYGKDFSYMFKNVSNGVATIITIPITEAINS